MVKLCIGGYKRCEEVWPGKEFTMLANNLDRITFSRNVMGGQACIRDIRVPVSLIVNLVAHGYSFSDVINDYEYLDEEDIKQALLYASIAVSDRIFATDGVDI